MKKYILLFCCILLSLFFTGCKSLDIHRLNKSLNSFYKGGKHFTITVNLEMFGQHAEATSKVCVDPFYLDLDGTGKTVYMQENDFLFLYEFNDERITRTLVGKMTDDSVLELLDYGEPVEIDLTKGTISYDKDTKEYTIEFNGKDALKSLLSYLKDLGYDDSVLDELYVITIKCTNSELSYKIKSKVKNPITNEKEDYIYDVNIKKGKFEIPSIDRLYTQEPSSIYEVVNMSNPEENQELSYYDLGNDYRSYNKYHLDKGQYCIIFNDGKTDYTYYRQNGFFLYDSDYQKLKVNYLVDVDNYGEYQYLFEIAESGDYYSLVMTFNKGGRYRIVKYTNSHEAHDISNIDSISGEIESSFDYHLMEYRSEKQGSLKITNNGLKEVYILYYRDHNLPNWDKKMLNPSDYFYFPIYQGENKIYIVSQFYSDFSKNHYDFDLRLEKIFNDDEKIVLSYEYSDEFIVIYGENTECEFEITEAGKYTVELSNNNLDAHIYYDYRIKLLEKGKVDVWYLVPGTYKVTILIPSQLKGTYDTTKAKLVKLK